MVALGSKYRAYPEYKDSGVEWFSSLPKDWGTSQIRYLFAFNKGLTITRANLVDSGIPCISYGEVHSKYGFDVDPERDELRYVSDNYLKSDPNSLLNYGDFIFADTSEDLEGSGNFSQFVGEGYAFAGYHTIILKPDSKLYSRYFAYLFDSDSLRNQIQEAVKGVKVFSITQAILRNCDLIVPPYVEQTKIAQFLDHETTKIDQLIEKQQKLIKLLEEKRQAVISHAVTKGLDPNAEMKDSGVEWFGTVPKDWNISQLRWKIIIQSGEAIQSDLVSKEKNHKNSVPVIGGNGVMGFYNKANVNSINIIVGRVGALCGNIHLITESSWISDNALQIFKICDFTYEYLALLLAALNLNRYASRNAQPLLTGETIKALKVAIPTIQEQAKIVVFINKMTVHFEELINKSYKQIELMQERRTALISAAVTGKIDVRDWEMPES